MHPRLRSIALALLIVFLIASSRLHASAYNAKPKLVVVIVIDQFRGDYLERYHDQLSPDGFRLLTDRGAYFDNCHYDYANLHTAPGHATLGTGAYTDAHGIMDNEWFSYDYGRVLSSVDDPVYQTLKGAGSSGEGTSPHNLLATTLGDELKFATRGQAKVFGISLKDRGAILPAGHSADAAYYIDKDDGEWISSSFYSKELPAWVQQYNAAKTTQKYLNLDWKDSSGKLLRSTRPATSNGKPVGFYDLVGATPFANDYQLDFTRELIEKEQLGKHDVTDMLFVSLSAFDILGHKVGPDSPELAQMTLTIDRQLAGLFKFLDSQVGLDNVWIALSADHGVSPLPDTASAMRFPAQIAEPEQIQRQLNSRLNQLLVKPVGTVDKNASAPVPFVSSVEWPTVFLDSRAFQEYGIPEQRAEEMTADIYQEIARLPQVFTRWDLMHGTVPNNAIGRRFEHTYSVLGGWAVLALRPIFTQAPVSGADHGAPYSYDTHVPLAFFGAPFKPGIYRTHSEPVDLAPTLANLLGTNLPSHSMGRVLTEAIVDQASSNPAVERKP